MSGRYQRLGRNPTSVTCGTVLGTIATALTLGAFIWLIVLTVNKNMITDLMVTGQFKLNGRDLTDFVQPPPRSIVVGQPTPGIDSFPVNVEPAVARRSDFSHLKNVKHRERAEKLQRSLHARVHQANIPVFPGPSAGGTFPYPNSVQCDTIRCAVDKLKGKQVNDTVIFVHPGEYEENVVLSGFSSTCDYRTGTYVNDTMFRASTCEGLIVVGDPRIVVGVTYTHDAALNRIPINDALGIAVPGLDGSPAVQLTCSEDPNTVTVTGYFGFLNPDFEALGVTDQDKIVMFNRAAGEYHERNVLSVSGNSITFDGVGCPVGARGDTLSVLPNRVIRGVAAVGNAPNDAPGSILSIGTNIQMYGFHIRRPATESVTNPVNSVTLEHGAPTISNMVIDSRDATVNTNLAVVGGSNNLFIEHGEQVIDSILAQILSINQLFGTSGAITIMSAGSGQALEVLSGAHFNLNDVTIINGDALILDESSATFEALTITAPSTVLQKIRLLVDRRGSARIGDLAIYGGGLPWQMQVGAGNIAIASAATPGFNAGSVQLRDSTPDGTCIKMFGDASANMAFTITALHGECSTLIDVAGPGNAIVTTLSSPSDFTNFYKIDDDASSVSINDVRRIGVNQLGSSVDLPIKLSHSVIVAPSPITVTLPADMSNYVGRSFTITSTTPYPHKIELSGGNSFPSTGSNSVTLDAKVGCAVIIKVADSNIAFIEAQTCATVATLAPTFAPTAVPTAVPTASPTA